MAATKYEAWKRNYNGYETPLDGDGWSNSGFSEEYRDGDQVFRRSVIACNPIEGCVLTTEMIVEQVRVPALTIHGGRFPEGGELKLYEFGDGKSSPMSTGAMRVYGAAGNRGDMSPRSSHNMGHTSPTNWKEKPSSKHPNGSGFSTKSRKVGYPEKRGQLEPYEVDHNGGSSPISRVPMKTDGGAHDKWNVSVSPPHQTGVRPMSTTNWKHRPNSNGSITNGSTYSWTNDYSPKGGHLEPNEVEDNCRSSPVSRGDVKVYEGVDNKWNMSVSPPQKTGPMSTMNWKQRPNSNGHGGSPDNWRNGVGTNVHAGHSGYASNEIRRHESEGNHGRNEKLTDTKHKFNPIKEIGITGVDDNEKETRKSPTAPTRPGRTQGRFTITHSAAPKEILPSTIDSSEAARRFGGYLVPPQVMKEARTYTPTIDSNDAAKLYKGQIL